MATATNAVRTSRARKSAGVAAELADLFRNLARALFDPYRPELHYMRGPGPKWRAKHARPAVLYPVGAPALVPVRIKR
jgi:hypothetical protein